MSGKVIHRPPAQHHCAPGWGQRKVSPPADLTATPDDPPSQTVLFPPHITDYPKGTAWQCDCGRVWVSRGERYAISEPYFTRERWWERRKRLKEAR